jgi:hypothetical protein
MLRAESEMQKTETSGETNFKPQTPNPKPQTRNSKPLMAWFFDVYGHEMERRGGIFYFEENR